MERNNPEEIRRVAKVIFSACLRADVAFEQVMSKRKNHDVSIVRHLIWYRLHDILGYSIKFLAEAFGVNERSITRRCSTMRYRILNDRPTLTLYNKLFNE
jgi:hypothetical protein